MEAAFEMARARLVQAQPPALAPSLPEAPPQPLDPRDAFAAPERWEGKAIRAAEVRLLNADPASHFSDEAARRSSVINLLGQRPMGMTEAWRRVDGFNPTLAAALRSEGIPATEEHPSLSRLRDEFAARWAAVLTAESKTEAGFWEWPLEPETDAPVSAASGITPAPACAPTSVSTSGNTATIRTMFDDYLRELGHTDAPEKTVADISRVLDRFVEFAGRAVPVSSVRTDLVRDFRDPRPSGPGSAVTSGSCLTNHAAG